MRQQLAHQATINYVQGPESKPITVKQLGKNQLGEIYGTVIQKFVL